MSANCKVILESVQVFSRELEALFKSYTEQTFEHELLQKKYRELELRCISLERDSGKPAAGGDKVTLHALDSLTEFSQLLTDYQLLYNAYKQLRSEHDRLRQTCAMTTRQLQFCTCKGSGAPKVEYKERIHLDIPGDRVPDSGSTLEVEKTSPIMSQRVDELTRTIVPQHTMAQNEKNTEMRASFKELRSAVQVLKFSVNRFSREFLEELTKRSKEAADSLLDRLGTGRYFSRKQHISTYALRSHIYELLFRGFNTKSFRYKMNDIASGSPHTRSGSWTCSDNFAYFQNSQVHTDPYFCAFWMERAYMFTQDFLLPVAESQLQQQNESLMTGFLEYLGGPLVSSFKEVCKSVWLLHKLVFAFDLPAALLEVPKNADFNTDYMEAVVSEEEDSNLTRKVGFMIAPGFRLQDHVIRSEVYLAGSRFKENVR